MAIDPHNTVKANQDTLLKILFAEKLFILLKQLKSFRGDHVGVEDINIRWIERYFFLNQVPNKLFKGNYLQGYF